MSGHVFVIAIVAISCVTAVFLQYLKTRQGEQKNSEPAEEMTAQLEALEERIRVLERIITERKFDLKSEIDRL